MLKLRWWPPGALVLAGLSALVAARITADITSRTVWIGLAATCITAGLVDGAQLIERARTTRPIRKLIGRRIGRVQQLVLDLGTTMFESPKKSEEQHWSDAFKSVPDGMLDLSTPANVHPPRSKAVRIQELSIELDAVRLELNGYIPAGVLVDEIDELDTILASSMILIFARSATAIGPIQSSSGPFSNDLAQLLEKIKPVVSVARSAAGTTWKYGDQK